MMRLIIVDDEALVREYIVNCVEQCGLPCEIVGSVPNAPAALRLLESEPCDVVFADITMPKMDGLELLGIIRAQWPQTEVVMLTCHDKFSFVRSAMQQNAADYVLKDEATPESIGNVLKKVQDKRDKAIAETRHEIDLTQFIQGVMSDPAIDSIDPEELSSYLGGCRLQNYAVLIFEYHKQVVDWLVEQKPAWIRQNWVVSYGEQFVLMLVEILPQLSENDCFRMLHSLRVNLQARSGRRLGLSGIYYNGALLKTAIREARTDMNRSFYIGDTHTAQKPGETDEESLKELFLYRNNAISALYSRNYTAFRSQVEQVFRFAKEHKVDVGRLKKMVHFMAEMTLSFAHLEEGDVYRRITGAAHITELEKVFSGLIERLNQNDYSEGIARAVKYLDEHFREDLTLQQLSQVACLNSEYFSRRFKKEVGMNYSEYLMQRRMAESMQLLRTTDQRIGEIAAQIGIPNVSYFSSAFKKIYGVSPNEVRKNR